MKNTLLAFVTALFFLGCSSQESSDKNIEPKLVIAKSIAALSLNDQHEKPHGITADTKTLVFAFSKDVGHTCNDFFATKAENYLNDNHALFIADVSGAPSIIRSMFIMPGLKDLKHTVLILDDKSIANEYKAGQDVKKIIIVSLQDKSITAVKAVDSTAELASEIETK